MIWTAERRSVFTMRIVTLSRCARSRGANATVFPVVRKDSYPEYEDWLAMAKELTAREIGEDWDDRAAAEAFYERHNERVRLEAPDGRPGRQSPLRAGTSGVARGRGAARICENVGPTRPVPQLALHNCRSEHSTRRSSRATPRNAKNYEKHEKDHSSPSIKSALRVMVEG